MKQVDTFRKNFRFFRTEVAEMEIMEMSEVLGFSRATIGVWEREGVAALGNEGKMPSLKVAYEMYNKFAVLPDWLLLGKGNMFENGISSFEEAKRYAHDAIQNGKSEYKTFVIEDDRMAPTLKVGDRSIGKVTMTTAIELGFVYGVRRKKTQQQDLVCRIDMIQEGHIEVSFDNHRYKGFDIDMEDIKAIYQIIENRTTQFPNI